MEMQPLNIDSEAMHQKRQALQHPPDCCPSFISKLFRCCARCIPKSVEKHWAHLRIAAHRLVEHPVFEWLIIISILASSIALVS
jgi:hypothetical protein